MTRKEAVDELVQELDHIIAFHERVGELPRSGPVFGSLCEATSFGQGIEKLRILNSQPVFGQDLKRDFAPCGTENPEAENLGWSLWKVNW